MKHILTLLLVASLSSTGLSAAGLHGKEPGKEKKAVGVRKAAKKQHKTAKYCPNRPGCICN